MEVCPRLAETGLKIKNVRTVTSVQTSDRNRDVTVKVNSSRHDTDQAAA